MRHMEIEIDSKKSNPLFNRTEVRFTIIHTGEGTPNREIIRSELAEKLNAKKENIIVNNINSSFGIQRSTGYAKIYTSPKKSEELERKYILKRNKATGKQQKKKEESEKKPEPAEETPKEGKKPSEESSQKVEEPAESKEDAKEEKPKEEAKQSEEKKE